MPVPVSITSSTTSPTPSWRPRRVPVPGGGVFLNALVSRPIITWRSRVGSPVAARSCSTSTTRSIRGGGSTAATTSRTAIATSTISLSGAPRLSTRASVSSDWVSAFIRSGGAACERVEEVVAVERVVFGAALQHLDRPRHPGQRIAQLVRGVGDEVGFGELAAELVGAVAEGGEDGALGRERPRGHRGR